MDQHYLLLDNMGDDASDASSVNSPHHRLSWTDTIKHKIKNRGHHRLSSHEKEKMAKIESLDFAVNDNIIWRKYQHSLSISAYLSKTLGKWLVALLIGFGVGLIIYCIKISTEHLNELKFHLVNSFLSDTRHRIIGFFIYYGFNLTFALLSCAIVIFSGMPVVASSGIPEVKGYLNGIRITRAFNLKTLIGKVTSLIFAFSSGLVLGPEGPMFHIGSSLGAALSQFKSKTLRFHSSIFWRFQNDRDKRDFISCGAAAGIAAAFGAPIGGVLYTLEEGSSFWSRQLVWRTFFACLCAVVTSNLFFQGFSMHIHDYGVLTLGIGGSSELYTYPELLPFLALGVVGGLLGALFVHINVKINEWRLRVLGTKPIHRIVEVIVLVTITSFLKFSLPFLFPCRDVSEITLIHQNATATCDQVIEPEVTPFICPPGQYNDLASIFYTNPETAMRLLYNRNLNIFSSITLITACIMYLILATITSGVYMASGIFIPMMVIGASMGRLMGRMVEMVVSSFYVDSGIYAVVGSAAMMAGSLRGTISLVVIIVELTEETQYLVPVILVVMIAKWTGDAFNESVYEHLMELKHIPYLPSHPPKSSQTVSDIMSQSVKCVPTLLRVRDALSLLRDVTHHGFPVYIPATVPSSALSSSSSSLSSSEEGVMINPETYLQPSAVCGIILRSQLMILLQKKVYGPISDFAPPNVPPSDFMRMSYRDPTCGKNLDHPTFAHLLAKSIKSVDSLNISADELDYFIDLRIYMNFSVVTCNKHFSYTEAYNLFRSLGLRHLVVVDDKHYPVGILTRKDFL
eukprot:TRINITY_DN3564_c0_g1_i1.p1 TRINITY_DN3564_c0_g1~~TRINITY_DN3564_c0_g1_i1.p1  ORF type:complete len:799 (-),score=188.89 TRINITY_DN3564_c0_g1_i1:47-2443(-)